MNREIKFRAWDTVLKIMVPSFDNWIDFDGNYWTTPDVTHDTTNTEIVRGHNYILMQFTGLTDKNGKEIYEGDLLKLKSINYPHYEPYIWEVYYSPESMMFRFRNNVPYPRNCDSDIWGLHDFEVIGNIYQNPELIKQLSK
jgi:uncharacterized phage protein (TIGR01671 family)